MSQYSNKKNQLVGLRADNTNILFDKTEVAGDPLVVTQSGIYSFSYHANVIQTSGTIETQIVTQLVVTPSSGPTQLPLRTLTRDLITVNDRASLHNAGEVFLDVDDEVGVRIYADSLPSGVAMQAERALCNITLRKL